MVLGWRRFERLSMVVRHLFSVGMVSRMKYKIVLGWICMGLGLNIILGTLMLRFQHADLTETQIFARYWVAYLVAVVLVFLGFSLSNSDS